MPGKKKTRAERIKASEKRLKEIKARWNIVTPKPKAKPKPKPKKKSLITRVKAYLKPKKRKKKTTWPSGITTQKAFDELMQIKRKKKKK